MSKVDVNGAENCFISAPARPFTVPWTRLDVNLFHLYSLMNRRSSSPLFQQSVRLISLCNRLSRSFLSRSNISVARSDDTLVRAASLLSLNNYKQALKQRAGSIVNLYYSKFIKLIGFAAIDTSNTLNCTRGKTSTTEEPLLLSLQSCPIFNINQINIIDRRQAA